MRRVIWRYETQKVDFKSLVEWTTLSISLDTVYSQRKSRTAFQLIHQSRESAVISIAHDIKGMDYRTLHARLESRRSTDGPGTGQMVRAVRESLIEGETTIAFVILRRKCKIL